MRTTPKMNLVSWDQLGDTYNFAQLAGNWQILDFHDHSPGRGVPIPAGGLASGAVLPSNIAANAVGTQHFALSTLQNLGLNQAGSVGRGYVSIPASQSTSSTTFTLLPTPDQVANISLATGGLIAIAYQATWWTSVTGAGSAGIFLGTNQGQSIASTTSTAPTPQAATGTTANIFASLGTVGGGLISGSQTSSYTGDITTGQIITSVGGSGGGPCYVFAAPGTYSVGIGFRVSSGTVTVLNRKLWVWTVNFN